MHLPLFPSKYDNVSVIETTSATAHLQGYARSALEADKFHESVSFVSLEKMRVVFFII